MSSILNFVLFQAGWLASVLGTSRGVEWLGPAVVAPYVAFHLAFRAARHEPRLVVASVGLGALLDGLLLRSGLVSYGGTALGGVLPPAWILAMWANLATTLEHSMAWVTRRPALAWAAGAVFGPLAYAAAERLGAVDLGAPVATTAALAAAWAVAMGALAHLARAD